VALCAIFTARYLRPQCQQIAIGKVAVRQLPPPALRGSARHRRQGAGSAHGAEVNMTLMRRLVEGAAASGDLRAAAEAVRVCMAEAENLYQLAMAGREKTLALARQAAEDQERTRRLHDEAATALEAPPDHAGKERAARTWTGTCLPRCQAVTALRARCAGH
jgi:hypothetical protein